MFTQTLESVQSLLSCLVTLFCLAEVSRFCFERSVVTLFIRFSTISFASHCEYHISRYIFAQELLFWQNKTRKIKLKKERNMSASIVRTRPFLRGCLHDTGTSFIPVRNLISYRVCMGDDTKFHVSPCSYKPLLERCCLSTRMRYLSQYTRPFISYRNEISYLLDMIPVQLQVGTGMNSYRNETRTGIM